MINLYHAICFSPNKTTWLSAIKKGFFLGWPDLSVKAVQQHLVQSTATTKGHMKQISKNYRSTAINSIATNNNPTTSTFTIFQFSGQSYSDLTGRFPVQSSKGNNDIHIFYHVDSNDILVEPLKNREQQSILTALKTIVESLLKKGFPLSLHIMDNEAP